MDDLTTFFVTYMKNDTLASIERAHPKPRDQIDVDDLTTFFVTYMKNDTLAIIEPAQPKPRSMWTILHLLRDLHEE